MALKSSNKDSKEVSKKSKDKKIIEDDANDFDFDSDSEEETKVVAGVKKQNFDNFGQESDESDIEGELSENEDDEREEVTVDSNNESEKEEDIMNDEDEDEDDEYDKIEQESASSKKLKLKKLTPEKIAKEEKRIKKTGVCYLSKIPPFMKPSKLRSVLSRFGKIDRLFLKPEDNSIYHKRVKYGGNKKKNYTEGWVEFVDKKDAKLCAATLNANILGGKKTSFYYDDVINMKYLKNFKWFDLTQQIARENEIRQAKLSLELSQQQKLNKNFINTVEESKKIRNMEKKRKAKEAEKGVENNDIEIRRNFKQRKVTSIRADAKEEFKERAKPNERLNDVLSKVF